MGLRKPTKLLSGVEVEYWRVGGDVRINPDTRQASFYIFGYKDKAVRDDTNVAVIPREIIVRGEDFDKFFGTKEDYRTQCYNCAKAKDVFFQDASSA